MQYKWPDLATFRKILREDFFLKKHEIRQSTRQLLQQVYPSVDWSRVDFYEGLPWFTPLAAPFVSAQALPHFYSMHRFRIYLKKYDESRAQCLADIIHEAYHVMQGMSFHKGYGLGFFRTWMVLYLADFFRNGYRQNVFEIPAFDQEFRFLAYCESKGLHGIQPPLPPNVLQSIDEHTGLLARHSSWPKIAGWWTIPAAIVLCLVVTVSKPALDLLLGALRLIVPKIAENAQVPKNEK